MPGAQHIITALTARTERAVHWVRAPGLIYEWSAKQPKPLPTEAQPLCFMRINTGPRGYEYLSLRKYRHADMPTLAQQAEIRSM
jgi:hypothetical protein